MSNNYATSTKTLLGKQLHRYVVWMEDIESGKVLTFSVLAARLSVCTAIVIGYISQHNIEYGALGYTLLPRIDNKTISDYTIN